MTRFMKFVVCIFLWTMTPYVAQGQERYALLIGNETYTKSIGKLSNPVKDIELIKAALLQIGFKEPNIEVIKNGDLGALNRARRSFQQRLRSAGTALGFFYYSGHGAAHKPNEAEKASNYIIPVDVDEKNGPSGMFESSLSLNNVIEDMRTAAPLADLIVVFDACRNELRIDARSLNSKTFVAETLPALSNGNTFLGFSTNTASPAYDSGEFAIALARELLRPELYHEQVFHNVSLAVKQATKNKQYPYYLDGFKTRLYFAQKQKSVDLQELTDWNNARTVNTVDGYKSFIRQHPNSSFSWEALQLQQERQEEVDWKLALSSGQIDDFDDFLSRHPAGRFAQQALDQIQALKKAEEDRDWRVARKSKSAELILNFLGKYPNTSRYEEARALITGLQSTVSSTSPSGETERAAWDAATQSDSIQALSEYLAKFNSALHAPAARAQLSILIEKRDWENVRSKRSIAATKQFMEKYPNGRYIEDARELILSYQQVAAVGSNVGTQLALKSKGISEDLLVQRKRLELRNLFFPKGTFASFKQGNILDRIDFRKAQPIRRLMLTNNLTKLYSGGDDGAVRIWDLNGSERSRILSPAHQKRIYSLVRSDNSRYMATGSWDRHVFLWDAQTSEIAGRVVVRPQIYAMAFSPIGRWIATAGTQGQVDFIRVKDRRIVNRRHVSPARTILALAYLPNKDEDLILGDGSGALRLWSYRKGREKYVAGAHSEKILTLTVSPDGHLVASAGTDRSIKLWTESLLKVSEIARAHSRYVTSLRFTPDGSMSTLR